VVGRERGEARENMARYLKSTTRLAQTQSQRAAGIICVECGGNIPTPSTHTKWEIRYKIKDDVCIPAL
jgi:hypothetical protein